MKPSSRLILLAAILSTWFLVVLHAATTYTVKTSGGNFTTASGCSGTAVGGDTCEFYADTPGGSKSYTGWTQSTSGSAGNLITFKAHSGDTITISTTTALGSTSYIKVGGDLSSEGFNHTGGFTWVTMTHNIIQNNNVHDTVSNQAGRCFTGPNSGNFASPGSTLNVFYHNTVTNCGGSSAGQGWFLEGDKNLIDSNTVSSVQDGMALYGNYNVVRNNIFGPLDHMDTNVHPDVVESSATCVAGNFDIVMTRFVFEGNQIYDWGATDQDQNAHIFLFRDTNSCGETDNMVRFNMAANIGSASYVVQSGSKNFRMYNNSIASVPMVASLKALQEFVLTTQGFGGATGAKVINNVFANSWISSGNPWMIYVDASSITGFIEHHNLGYYSSGGRTWQGPPASGGNTYAASDIFNQDPKFVNILSDLSTQSGSATLNAGGALTTTNGSGTTSTNLVLASGGASFFQDGYGITFSLAPVYADWLCVGTVTNCDQISSINYSTDTITLVTGLSWTSGQNVWLYKKSDGVVVLAGSAPDIGAYEYGVVTATIPRRFRFARVP